MLQTLGQSVEKQVASKYEHEGWTVLRSGWPDLFCYRVAADGTLSVCLREVKSAKDTLRPNQIVILEILHKLGLDTGVIWLGSGTETPGGTELAPPLPTVKVGPRELPEGQKIRPLTADGGYVVRKKPRKDGSPYIKYPCPICQRFNGRYWGLCRPCDERWEYRVVLTEDGKWLEDEKTGEKFSVEEERAKFCHFKK